MLNPYAIIAALVLAAMLFGSGVSVGRKWEEGQQAVEKQHIKEAVDAANDAAGEAISKIKVVNKTIQGEVRHEIETNTVYRDCKQPASGVRLVNEALDPQYQPKRDGEGKLPKADTNSGG